MHPVVASEHSSHLCFLLQLKLEDRSVVPRDVVRHMRSTVSSHIPTPSLGLRAAIWELEPAPCTLLRRELPSSGGGSPGAIWAGVYCSGLAWTLPPSSRTVSVAQ
jgi:hypothetical protein